MAQKIRPLRQKNSDFPIFDYINRITPNHFIAAYQELPRHIRWTIISTIASLVLLWAVLTIAVGGINHHLATRGAFLYDALYTPYDLELRPIPTLPEADAIEESFRVLPEMIADRYLLQIPPSSEELEAQAQAERDAFLALSAPAQHSLEMHQGRLNELMETTLAAETAPEPETDPVPSDSTSVATQTDPAAAPNNQAQIAESSSSIENAFAQAVHAQSTAVNLALAELAQINASVAEEETMDRVFVRLQALRDALARVDVAGLDIPELASLSSQLEALAAVELPTPYRINECLLSSLASTDSEDMNKRPCAISPSTSFVETGSYESDGAIYNITVAAFDIHDTATDVVSSLYHYGRSIGGTGNFSLGVIEYDYFFHFGDDLYTFTWSHEEWVYSVTGPTFADLDSLLRIFPY